MLHISHVFINNGISYFIFFLITSLEVTQPQRSLVCRPSDETSAQRRSFKKNKKKKNKFSLSLSVSRPINEAMNSSAAHPSCLTKASIRIEPNIPQFNNDNGSEWRRLPKMYFKCYALIGPLEPRGVNSHRYEDNIQLMIFITREARAVAL